MDTLETNKTLDFDLPEKERVDFEIVQKSLTENEAKTNELVGDIEHHAFCFCLNDIFYSTSTFSASYCQAIKLKASVHRSLHVEDELGVSSLVCGWKRR